MKKMSAEKLLQKTSSGDELINIINPALNTVPYAYILLALYETRTQMTEASEEFLWQKFSNFLTKFDARQVRYIGNEWLKIIDAVVSMAKYNKNVASAVPLISAALVRLDPEGTVLTSTHLLLVNLALETRNFASLPAIISRPVLYFSGKISTSRVPQLCNLALPNHVFISPTTGLTKTMKASEVLEYFIYTASIFVAMRQWNQAIEALEDAISYPCKEHSTSKIMVEAYKKWILVSLLSRGKMSKVPASVSSSTLRVFHSMAKPYGTVAEIFMKGTASRLNAEAVAGANFWRTDNNKSLIKAVLGAYQKHQIRGLASVYTTLSMSEVTRKTYSAITGKNLPNDQATEQLVRRMIKEGSLNASLGSNSNGSTILHFEAAQALSESEMAKKLDAALQNIQAVTRDVKQTDHRLSEDREYLRWAHRQRKLGSKGPVNVLHELQEEMDLTWTGPDEDEDLMSA